jgi:L-2-hydroxyglutarate oxidase LhgO
MVHTEHAEVIVVGAGIGGLAAAKTYLELSPGTSLLLIEKVSIAAMHSPSLYGSNIRSDQL